MLGGGAGWGLGDDVGKAVAHPDVAGLVEAHGGGGGVQLGVRPLDPHLETKPTVLSAMTAPKGDRGEGGVIIFRARGLGGGVHGEQVVVLRCLIWYDWWGSPSAARQRSRVPAVATALHWQAGRPAGHLEVAQARGETAFLGQRPQRRVLVHHVRQRPHAAPEERLAVLEEEPVHPSPHHAAIAIAGPELLRIQLCGGCCSCCPSTAIAALDRHQLGGAATTPKPLHINIDKSK